jgi:flagellar FliL protein
MAKPEQPKDIKPKEGEGAEPKVKKPIDENMKVIIINLVTTVLICILFLSVITIVVSSMLDSKLAKVTAGASAGDSAATADDPSAGEDTSSEVQKGIIVDLGDFILNLSDVAPRKYLKVNVALEVSSKAEDAAPAAGGEKKEGGEKGAAASPVDAEMAQFKPAFRDAVINTLSSKTSAELSTVAGKELAKDQITEAVNALFAGEREVLRVSFGDFIIQ